MLYVTQVCWQLDKEQDQDGTAVSFWSCSQAVWHIPLMSVQWKTPDDGQRNCPKHVQFYSQNKFEKLVPLIVFIIRIYHDARSPERQICQHTPVHNTLKQELLLAFLFNVFSKHVIRSVAARSKACVCGHSLAAIAGSNPGGVIDVCFLWMLCVVRYRNLTSW